MKRVARWCLNMFPALIIGAVIWSMLSGEQHLADEYLRSMVMGYGFAFGASYGLDLEIIEVKEDGDPK